MTVKIERWQEAAGFQPRGRFDFSAESASRPDKGTQTGSLLALSQPGNVMLLGHWWLITALCSGGINSCGFTEQAGMQIMSFFFYFTVKQNAQA